MSSRNVAVCSSLLISLYFSSRLMLFRGWITMNLPVVLIVLAISFFWIYRRVFYRPFSNVLYAHLHIPRLMRQMFKRGSISGKLNSPLPEDIIISILSFATRRELNAIQECNSVLNLLISSYFSSRPLELIQVYLIYFEGELFLTRDRNVGCHKQPKGVNRRGFCKFFNHPHYETLVQTKYLRVEVFNIWVDEAMVPNHWFHSFVSKKLVELRHLWDSGHLGIHYSNSLELNNAFHDWAFGQSGIFSSSIQTTFSDGQFPTTELMLSSHTTKIASFQCPYLPHQCLNFVVMIDWLWAKNDRWIFVWDAQLCGPTSIYSIFDRFKERFISSTTRSNFKFFIVLFWPENKDVWQRLRFDASIIGPVFNHTTAEKLVVYPVYMQGQRNRIKTLLIRRLGMQEKYEKIWFCLKKYLV